MCGTVVNTQKDTIHSYFGVQLSKDMQTLADMHQEDKTHSQAKQLPPNSPAFSVHLCTIFHADVFLNAATTTILGSHNSLATFFIHIKYFVIVLATF